jgi:hypothetical protein
MVLAELDFGQTLIANAVGTGLTALLVAGLAAWVVARYQAEQDRREALRETFNLFLVAQRRSREASTALCAAVDTPAATDLGRAATHAGDEFIERYHALNLDASRDMWLEARGLRDVLEHLLAAAQQGDKEECEHLSKLARDARQNLERSFRARLGQRPLQRRRPLGRFDKVGATKVYAAGRASVRGRMVAEWRVEADAADRLLDDWDAKASMRGIGRDHRDYWPTGEKWMQETSPGGS